MLADSVGHYQILQMIGSGGMGVVYKAIDTRLNRPVAIKELYDSIREDCSTIERVRREAQAAASIDHPYICKIYELLETQDHVLIVMEFLEGETLEELLKRGPLPPADTLRFAAELCEALSAAHAKGLIHRDVKPSNIIITPNGHLKVNDFGLAKVREDPSRDRGDTRTTLTGVFVGSPMYMSPEQAVGDAIDHRSDIFAIGVVIFECLTGRLPFEGNSDRTYLQSLVTLLPQSLRAPGPAVPDELERVVLKCLEKDPSQRFNSAAELEGELNRISEQVLPGGTGRLWRRFGFGTPPLPRIRPPLYRWLAPPVALLLLVLLFVATPLRRPVENWLGLGLPAQKDIAVLPLANISGNPNDQFLCDGLVEMLTSQLTLLEQFQGSLFVVPAAEVRQRKLTTPSEARKALGVTLVVTGSFQRDADRLQLTLNLVDTESLRQLRSAVLDDVATNVSLLQERVVTDLANMLELELQPKGMRVLAAGTTTVPGALEFYLQGRGHLQRYDRQTNIDLAIDLFKRALKEDPEYALAHAGLGEAYWRKYGATNDVAWLTPALKNCERALALNDELAPVHVTLGMVKNSTGQHEQAVVHFQRALQIDRRNADAFRGSARAYESLGKVSEAESTYRTAIELRRNDWAGYNLLGSFYYRQGRYKEAIEQWRNVVALTPDNPRGYNNLGAAYLQLRQWSDARQVFEQSLKIEPSDGTYSNLASIYYREKRYADAVRMYEKALDLNDKDYRIWGNLASARQWVKRDDLAKQAYERAARLAEEKRALNPRDTVVLANLASYYANLGQRSTADNLLQECERLAPDDVNVVIRVAQGYEELGRRQEALDWIKRAIQKGYPLESIESSPTFQNLRSDPNFHRLVR